VVHFSIVTFLLMMLRDLTSDCGSQYVSMGYRTMLSENGIMPSVNALGCSYGNACMESFFAGIQDSGRI